MAGYVTLAYQIKIEVRALRFVGCCLKVAVCGLKLAAAVDDDVFRLSYVLPSVY